MRTTGSTVRRLFAGAFLAVVLSLTLAGVAGAQSTNSSNPSTNSSTPASSSSSKAAGTTLGRTGAEMWIPLMVGGVVLTAAIATRIGLSRAAHRSS